MSRSIRPSAERVLITSNGAKKIEREFYVDLYCVAFEVRGILQSHKPASPVVNFT